MADGVVNVYIDPTTDLLAAPGCPNPVLETFLAGTEPVDICNVHGGVPEEEEHQSDSKDRSWWHQLRNWWGV
ncbi:hypothetical protein [Cohnella kolymensis]|uniref:hypothetical protein n=1 Tax=Cohnella kolymensis TaxID=1590652 RepID=UPI000AC3742B|nr:hypothetical protein [Cohnella kolymensis]